MFAKFTVSTWNVEDYNNSDNHFKDLLLNSGLVYCKLFYALGWISWLNVIKHPTNSLPSTEL